MVIIELPGRALSIAAGSRHSAAIVASQIPFVHSASGFHEGDLGDHHHHHHNNNNIINNNNSSSNNNNDDNGKNADGLPVSTTASTASQSQSRHRHTLRSSHTNGRKSGRTNGRKSGRTYGHNIRMLYTWGGNRYGALVWQPCTNTVLILY